MVLPCPDPIRYRIYAGSRSIGSEPGIWGRQECESCANPIALSHTLDSTRTAVALGEEEDDEQVPAIYPCPGLRLGEVIRFIQARLAPTVPAIAHR
jgi:hypothetical protein